MPAEDEMAREGANKELRLVVEKEKQRAKFSIRNELLKKEGLH